MTEHDIQSSFVAWCRLHEWKWPELKLAFAVPNGGKRNIATAVKLKREGARAGVPDWCLPVPKNGLSGLWIEFKKGKNKPTANQAEYISLLSAHAHIVAVCYSVDEAIDVLKAYLNQAN